MIARIGGLEGLGQRQGPVTPNGVDGEEWRLQMQRASLASAARAGLSPRLASLPLDLLIATMPVEAGEAVATPSAGVLDAEALGPNRGLAGPISAAAERTGIPAAALAAIIDAEAARTPSGAWDCRCRNPRSSAAGLGQFLSGTWIGEAERRGTYLHDVAARNGWLDRDGRVLAAAKPALLALRDDPKASIEAIGDYARANLSRLKKAGVRVDEGDVGGVARLAYIAHHLGPGDGARYLSGRLGGERARQLLAAQVGRTAAAQAERLTDDPAQAHRKWLESYVSRRLDVRRFEA